MKTPITNFGFGDGVVAYHTFNMGGKQRVELIGLVFGHYTVRPDARSRNVYAHVSACLN